MTEILVRVREAVSVASGTQSLIIAAAVLLVVLLVVGAAVYISRIYSPSGRVQLLLESRETDRASDSRRWVRRGIYAAVAAAVVLAVSFYAEMPQTCGVCHSTADYAEPLSESVHAAAGCADCHRSVGATARARDSLRYVGWVWTQYMTQQTSSAVADPSVESGRCLSCHGAVRDDIVVAAGIRVRHEDFLNRGDDCILCHGGLGHATARGAQAQAIMNHCLPCHNGVDVSSECSICHVDDVAIRSVAVKRSGNMATVTTIGDTGDCYRCHDPDPCYRCHGVTMPHPPGYVGDDLPTFARTEGLAGWGVGTGFDAGGHARDGFANRETCWRCHHEPGNVFTPSNSGCSCHGLFGNMHGGAAWVAEHGLQATGQKTGTLAGCDQCHGSVQRFCGMCHPPGYAERFYPRIGPDNYTPSQPRLGE